MAVHQDRIKLDIGENAEKKLNDFIEKAEELLKEIESIEKSNAEDTTKRTRS